MASGDFASVKMVSASHFGFLGDFLTNSRFLVCCFCRGVMVVDCGGDELCASGEIPASGGDDKGEEDAGDFILSCGRLWSSDACISVGCFSRLRKRIVCFPPGVDGPSYLPA